MSVNLDNTTLVLTGRDIHGIGGLALLEFLEKIHSPVHAVIGTSGGALVGALWTQGFNLGEIEDICVDIVSILYNLPQDYINTLLFFWAPTEHLNLSRAILNPKKLKKRLQEIFGERTLESCHLPTTIMLTNAMDATPLAINSGKLADVLYAALATPPMLPPGKIKGHWFVDGIFSEAVPVMQAVKSNAGKILVFNAMSAPVNVNEDFTRQYMHFISRSAFHAQKGKISLAIDLHSDEIFFINITASPEVTKVDTIATELLMKGRLNVMRHEQNILQLLSAKGERHD